MKIKIEWLTDSNECETCGGGYAEGAKVWIDDALALDLTPHADCFGSDHDWSERDVLQRLLEHLGHTLEIGAPEDGVRGE